MKDILICIPFHYAPERIKYLNKVINCFAEDYKVDFDIIIDTNDLIPYRVMVHPDDSRTKIVRRDNMEHPFHLTWFHRYHIREHIDNYKNFMYIEDDMLLPFENYLNYLENFKLLWPNYVPSFVRIEKKDRQDYISDIPQQQELKITEVGGKKFHAFPFPINYHAFWIMPQKELKETMKDNFARLSDGREFAAMYVGWELGRTALVEINQIGGFGAGEKLIYGVSEKCYSYHLPNNYAFGDGPNGKIRPNNIFL